MAKDGDNESRHCPPLTRPPAPSTVHPLRIIDHHRDLMDRVRHISLIKVCPHLAKPWRHSRTVWPLFQPRPNRCSVVPPFFFKHSKKASLCGRLAIFENKLMNAPQRGTQFQAFKNGITVVQFGHFFKTHKLMQRRDQFSCH